MFFLIQNGSQQAGKRPRCSLAFWTGVKLQIWNGRLWQDSSKCFSDLTIYHQWEREPTPQQVRRAKLRLHPRH